MDHQTTVTIALGERSYPVHIGDGELCRLGTRLSDRGLARRTLVVTNPAIARRYGETVREAIAAAGGEATVALVPAGERSKRLAYVERLCDIAIAAGLDRKSTVVALGGGVIGDLAGYVAASLFRGVAFVQLPTTLVAMVDSSVGGKTGVNSKLGKNLIGAFWQPQLVVADLATLRSLPPRELRCGLAEVIKHGAILDAALFERLEQAFDPAAAKGELSCGRASLSLELARYCVVRSCELKGAVVAADERESGQRAWLNFGHTFGHALEAVSGYGQLHHGEAVAIGMVLATRLGVARGELPAEVLERLVRLLEAVGLPTRWPAEVAVGDVFAAMYRDKKVRDGALNLVLLERLGQARVVGDAPPEQVRQILEAAAREA